MLETERLLLRPLTYNQLLLYRKADQSLEKDLGVEKSLFAVNAELQEALDQTIIPNVADASKNYLFNTLWTLILKERNQMVGDLCFLGEPGPSGEIEIGYGIYPSFQNNGLMTEAVAAMVDWAAGQPDVKAIIASTSKDNTASFGVLVKNHFLRVGENGLMYNWRKKLEPREIEE